MELAEKDANGEGAEASVAANGAHAEEPAAAQPEQDGAIERLDLLAIRLLQKFAKPTLHISLASRRTLSVVEPAILLKIKPPEADAFELNVGLISGALCRAASACG